MPASYAPALLVATVAATVSLMGVGAFACVLLPLPLTVTGLMLLKGVVCACAGAVAGYITICYVVRSGTRQSTVNRRSWETQDALRLFFCVMVSVTCSHCGMVVA